MGIAALALCAVPVSLLVFKAIDRTVGCRVTAEEERVGLDMTQHGLEAYPRAVGEEVGYASAAYVPRAAQNRTPAIEEPEPGRAGAA